MDGILNLNKPFGITSRRAMDQVQRLLQVKKAGHGGTLDPIATGVLLICLGRATKLFEALQVGTKTYQATMMLGLTTDSFDTSGEILSTSDASQITTDQIEQVLCRFTGQIEQTVPMFSAVKRQGIRLYKMARKGIQLDDLPKRRVEISSLELISVDLTPPFTDEHLAGALCSQPFDMSQPRPEGASAHTSTLNATFRIICTKGTYIRSLVSDIGKDLTCGAVLSGLTRTSSGVFHLQDAYTIEQIKQNPSIASDAIIPLEQARQVLDHYRGQLYSDKGPKACW